MLELLLTAKLMALTTKVNDAQPKRERDFAATMARLRREHEARQAKHRQERLARGLCAQAGSGVPEPAIVLRQTGTDDFPYERYAKRPLQQLIADKRRHLQAKIAIGATRVGGVPDLPPAGEWPTQRGQKLPFLAQINLAEIASFKNPLLPPDGWLYAFGPFENERAEMFIYGGSADALVRAHEPDRNSMLDGEAVYEPVPVRIAPRQKNELLGDRYDAGRPAGWLFGEPYGEWGTPGEMADRLFREGDDWINLLAIESVGTMQWSDCGQLYLLVRRSDLEKADLSQVLADIWSS